MNETNTNKIFQLRTLDNYICQIDVAVANGSRVLMEAAKVFDDVSDITTVPIKWDILRCIISWLDYHQDSNESINYEGLLSSWENDFFQVNDETLIAIQVAANYLDIDELFNLASKTIAERVSALIVDRIQSGNSFDDKESNSIH